MNEDGRPRALRGRRRGEVAALVAREFVRSLRTIEELAHLFQRRPSLIRRLLEETGLCAEGVACLGVPTEELAAMLAQRYRSGASIDSLAAATGLAWPVVRELLVRSGVTLRPRNSVPSPMLDWVIEQYRAGATLRSLADETGCSYSTVRRHLVTAGVSLRPPGVSKQTGAR